MRLNLIENNRQGFGQRSSGMIAEYVATMSACEDSIFNCK